MSSYGPHAPQLGSALRAFLSQSAAEYVSLPLWLGAWSRMLMQYPRMHTQTQHLRLQHQQQKQRAQHRLLLPRLLSAVRSWELLPGTPCCQVLVPESASTVDVPHVVIG